MFATVSTSPGFTNVRNSRKPAWVVPSANDHDVRGPSVPTTAWAPLADRPATSASKYMARSAAIACEAVTTAPTPTWPGPTPGASTTWTVVRDSGGNSKGLSGGGGPSSSAYVIHADTLSGDWVERSR